MLKVISNTTPAPRRANKLADFALNKIEQQKRAT